MEYPTDRGSRCGHSCPYQDSLHSVYLHLFCLAVKLLSVSLSYHTIGIHTDVLVFGQQ